MNRHTTLVSEWPEADASVLTLSGEYDADDVAELMGRMSQALGSGAGGLTIDLRRVTFIDSAMIGALLGCSQRLTARKGRLVVLVDRSSTVYRTLELTALHRRFALFDSRRDASAYLLNGDAAAS